VPRTERTPIDGCQLSPFFNGAEIDARHGAVSDPLPIVALREAQAMAAAAIHVVPDDNFDDRVVRADIGQEFDHYPTREAAERVAQAIAQEREVELVVHLPDGKTSRTDFTKAGPPNYSGDDPAESSDAPLHLHAVDMLAGPCQQLRQGHYTGLARNLPAVVHEHQRRYALDGEPP
jgi:Uncharacterized protein conserved in bacteria (DUF2188)